MRRAAFVVILACCAAARAERLPVHVFTTADGLANNRVDGAAQDAHGFLWFATGEGVSRFDARRFESFGLADGLPAAITHAVLATPDGAVWVATDGGVAVLDTAATVRPRFTRVTDDAAYALAADPDGGLWVGSWNGLAHIDPGGAVKRVPLDGGVLAISVDPRDRSLWLGTFHGLVHRGRDGVVARWRVGPAGERDDRVFGVHVARDGAVWIGSVGELVLRAEKIDGAGPLVDAPGMGVFHIVGGARRGFLEDAQGTIWIGTTLDAYRWRAGALERLGRSQLGVAGSPSPLVEDSAGNLWFGTDAEGAVRLAHGGLVAFGAEDGFTGTGAYGFAFDRAGVLSVMVRGTEVMFAQHTGERFASARPLTPTGSAVGTWVYGQVMVNDRDGRWWMPNAEGLVRYPAGTVFDGSERGEMIAGGGAGVLHLYEDRRGDMWITASLPEQTARWERATDRLVIEPGMPEGELASAFAEDAHGDLWIAFQTEIVRIHDGERARMKSPIENPVALLFDHAGRMWLASEGAGVVRIDDTRGELAHVARRYGLAELGTMQALTLVEDLAGRVYVGTSRGITRIDENEVVAFDAADGVPSSYVHASIRDRDGALWFGMKYGLARLMPEASRAVAPPRIFITSLAVAGARQALAPGGELHVGALELASRDTALDVEVASPELAIDAGVRFEYRLDDDLAWSAPVAEPVLHFARFAPGDYELEVRAVDARGAMSASASVGFTVLPPIWRRWWFMTAAAAAIALLVYAAYRRRLAHLLAVERVRRRIATDLHDELGSGLSRISILSEVARASAPPDKLEGQLEVIGTSARELVDVASDIVWATDPRRDDLGSLIVRLRSFAADVFEARGVAWSVRAPADPDRIRLDPERRRHLYLVMKEAIANAARHSGATEVDVTIALERGELVATVRDNGRGFTEATLPGTGNGLGNMRARAAEAGGRLEIRADAGTQVVLRLFE